jgi:serine/threonine-protein kinase
MTEMSGRQIGQYELMDRLGRGGMAEVFRARQITVNRQVAIKVVIPEIAQTPEFINRFKREAEIVANLSHPHILKLFDYGTQDGLLYLVMELQPGGNLADLIRKAPLPLDKAITLIGQIAGALDSAHAQGIIHRDLKPQNVLLDKQGNAYLADFGIAKMMQADMTNFTNTGATMGTPAYMAPEQWEGSTIDARTDIYALGIMAYEMLSGEVPFKAETPASMMYAHLQATPPPLRREGSNLPALVDEVLRGALAKRPEDRYPSATTFAEALRAAADGRVFSAASAVRSTTTTPPAIVAPATSGAGALTPPTPTGSGQPKTMPSRPAPAARGGSRAGLLVVALAGLVLIGAGVVFALSQRENNVRAQQDLVLTALAGTNSVGIALTATRSVEQTAIAVAMQPTATATQTPAPPSDTPTDSPPTLTATPTPDAAETAYAASIMQAVQETAAAGRTQTVIASTPTDTATATASATTTFTPSATRTPTNTATPAPCLTLTPAPLLVEPIPATTTALTLTLTITAKHIEWITVTSDSTNAFFSAGQPVMIALTPNTTHRFAVAAQIGNFSIGGCTYGGYVLTTQVDRLGNPLIIQQLATPTPTATETFTPSATVTPSPTATASHTVTASATATFTPSVTVTASPSPTPEVIRAKVVVSTNSVNVRNGPGSAYARLGVAYRDEEYLTVAKVGTGINLWYLIEWKDDRRSWIWSGAVTLVGDLNQIEAAKTIPVPPATRTFTPLPPTQPPASNPNPQPGPTSPPGPTSVPPTATYIPLPTDDPFPTDICSTCLPYSSAEME